MKRLVAAGCLFAAAIGSARAGEDFGRVTFTDRREPPPVAALDDGTRARFDLGLLVFNSAWAPAGTPRAERRDGIGPLFNAASCDGCHNNGARGRAAGREGLVPNSFVLQLGGPDPHYGHVLNTSALTGQRREGAVAVRYETRAGRYADGRPWVLREPRYALVELGYGPLAARTVLKPRVGPALFGVGLLESVPRAVIDEIRRAQPRGQRGAFGNGRFGWEAEAVSVQDQTERALEREMGLTSMNRPRDDCTQLQTACRDAPNGGEPEVSSEFLEALLTFQRELAVPASGRASDSRGATAFEHIGCAACHQPQLAGRYAERDVVLRPYTDLLVHDLGSALSDRRVDGSLAHTRFRTAPLWGLAHELQRGEAALLHDGRARSVEEAILWHGGQAGTARERFVAASVEERRALVGFVESL